MKGITRVEGGYLARHYWGKPEPLSEYFYDHEFGSAESAEDAAVRWLERIAKEYPAPEKKGRKPGIKYMREQNMLYVMVHWSTIENEKEIQHTKKFYYSNDLEKKEAEHKARNFYSARVKDFYQ